MTGCSTSGIWLTRRFLNASRPIAMSTMTMATVVTGCLMLKLERNMASASGRSGALRQDGGGACGFGHLYRLTIMQRGGGVPQEAVPLLDSTVEHELAAAHVFLTNVESD